MLELRKEWEESESIIVRISQIESRILNIATVLDISNTTINGGTGNIELKNYKIPVLGEVVVV